MSIPHKLGINNSNDFNRGIYIKPTKEKIDKWKQILKKHNDRMVVGIHWQGNIDFEQKLYSKGRSIPYKEFNNLSGIKDVEYLSLQKGKEKENRKQLQGLQFISGNETFENTLNFEDTAGAIANCDLVVTSDSCIAHLAGAMGIKTLVLLSYVPEWRWGLEHSSTFWYNNMKLIRQKKPGDWCNVMAEVKVEILNQTKT